MAIKHWGDMTHGERCDQLRVENAKLMAEVKKKAEADAAWFAGEKKAKEEKHGTANVEDGTVSERAGE